MQFLTALFIAASAGFASAADIQVTVGDAGSLAFNPTSVTAQAGDTVIFEFRAKNHSVTQSSFAQPCTFLTSAAGPGVDSGFQPVPAGSTSFPQWSITIDNSSAPLWFYCAQNTPANHCKAGMVFAINPTADKSFDSFQTAAKASDPSAPAGGASSGSASASAPSASSTGSSSLSVPGGPLSTISGFSTSALPTSTGSPAATNSASANGTSTAGSGNGALGIRVNGGAATVLAAIGLLAGLIL